MRPAFWRQPWVTSAGAFVAAATAAFLFVFPAAGAAVCPQCFGFERIDGAIYAERGMPSEQRAHATGVIAKARERVLAFYGSRLGEAAVLLCATDACHHRMGGGGSHGVAFYDRVLILSPRGITETVAAHELAHIELHRRVGAWKIFRDAIPAWFDEGLAVVVSGDPRYIAPPGMTDVCRGVGGEPLPATLREWLQHAEQDRLYYRAACQVSRWLSINGGSAAVLRLAQDVANGMPFDEAYRNRRRAPP